MATVSNDPFTSRINEVKSQPKEDPFTKRSKDVQSKSKSYWDQTLDMIFSPQDSAFEEGLGQVIRSAGTAIAGIPGNVIQSVKSLSENLPESPIKSEPSFIQKKGREYLEKIPTSSQLQESFDEKTSGKYKPTSRGEEFAQETIGDIASLLVPASKLSSVAKAIAIGSIGNLTKEGLKELGASGSTQEYTKMGSMLLASMFNPKGAMDYTKKLYDRAASFIPKDAKIPAANFLSKVQDLENQLNKGLTSIPSKAPVLSALEEMKKNIHQGELPINNLMELKRNLNEQKTIRIYDPELRGQNKVKDSLKKNYKEATKILDEAIEEYGKSNPEFLKYYRPANSAFGGIQQSKKIADTISRSMKGYKAKSIGLGLILEGVLHPQAIIPTVATGVGAFGALKSGELMTRIIRNPTLRKYYIQTITEAAKDNSMSTLRSLQVLDRKLADEESKDNSR